MLSPNGPSMFFFSVLWLVWAVAGIATLVMFYRGMTALMKIPDRLERIERALSGHGVATDDRGT